jgi:hypothetical protein
MSTKTTFKRIALATVAAMGFGLLSVVPANAVTEEITDIDGVAITTVFPSGRTGVAAVLANTITFNATAVAADLPVIASQLVSKPATSLSTVALTYASDTTTGVEAADFAFGAGTTVAAATAALTVGTNGDFVADETVTLNATFTPDVAGTYELVTWYDVDEDGAIDTGETVATKSISVVAGSDAVTATLTQYNSTACPPLINLDVQNSPNCESINDFVMEQVAKHPPKIILLHANWVIYKKYNITDQLLKTIEALKIAAPQSKIMVIGSVPQWEGSLPAVLISKNMGLSQEWHLVNIDLPKIKTLDANIFAITQALEVGFLSPIDALCQDGKCLATTPYDGKIHLTAWDYGHLTEAGSALLAQKLFIKNQ